MTQRVAALRESKHANLVLALVILGLAVLLPYFFDPRASFMNNAVLALAYVVMALGLNIVVGFAGLLDLGYVAFYAFGSYSMGWFASDFFNRVNSGKGIHIGAGTFATTLPGIHLNFLIVAVIAVLICAVVGILIGLPTLRLRGDYIAIVTLAFGEIIRVFAFFGDDIKFAAGYKLTNGRDSISPVDQIQLPLLSEFDSAFSLRPYYWFALAMVAFVLFVNFRLRDSRLGRAWVAIREDEVAAASMGVPLVKTKLLAYATGGALGGMAGAFLGSYYNAVNANQFQFGFSIFILAMIILGGLGSVWGVVFGAILLSYINTYFIPDVFNTLPSKIGLDFDLTQLSFGIFGFLIVLVMILRPEGLLPERRRKLELVDHVGTGDSQVYEVRG
ncbi:MAG: branched-chain amino acid transport system permease protein [Solirubrobacteraceae bacterium]|jgi:branched-chain amino acid transport system permease protein|nr:branched-chain amino acid transport system permease protein [Solirubrobacteraceae bacterium]